MAPKKAVKWSDGVEPKAVDSKNNNGGMVTRSSSTRRRVDESDELPQAKKPKSSTGSKGRGKGVKEAGKIAAAAAVAVAEHLESEGAAGEGKTKTVVIEHCCIDIFPFFSKQCNSFKTRAVQVKNGLENGLPGITVLVNPEKDLKRPFKPMKDLDMDDVIADIIGKINFDLLEALVLEFDN
ncbi:hypothetical protein RHSIM_Rhsim09G0030000 [Rhododendron simsii]|uniref:Uncharacterized protein n=1 Tax=Rhododendron simsii TaxID=118357 RepID=A0A834LH13_RHOSS|nr:hypothetical protein RHSIM_Rhsim09G0030000 [Rhododendron simsii]